MYRNLLLAPSTDHALFLTTMLCVIGFVESAYSAAKETEIRSETVLAASYDMISRPEAQTTVKVGISIFAINELDLKSQTFEAAGWVLFLWWPYMYRAAEHTQVMLITPGMGDSRLTWTPSAKDDIEYIYSKPEDIWKPAVFVDNSLEDLATISSSELYLRVKYTGLVEWEPPKLFTTHCVVDITYYPYDKQSCSIDITGIGHTVDEVKLDTLSTPVNLEDFEEHGEWEITGTSVKKSNLSETLDDGTVRLYPKIQFILKLDRRSNYYNINVVMPIFLTSLLVVLTFVVPVDSGEKLSYILTVFLSITVLLTLVADSVPSTSITTSVLGVYLAIVTILSGCGIFLTVIILIMFHKTGSPRSPSCILVIARFAAVLTCNKDTNLVMPMKEDKLDTKSTTSCEETFALSWKEVAVVLDRLCLLIFTTVTLCINVSFVIGLVAGGNAQ